MDTSWPRMVSDGKIRIRIFMAVSFLSMVILAIGLAAQWPFLAGVKDFRYHYREWMPLEGLITPTLWATLFLLCFFWSYRKGCKLRHLILLIVLAYFFQSSVLAAGNRGITGVGLVISDPAITSYFQPASELKLLSLAKYPAMMEKFFMHARTHPPGPILFIRGILKVFEASPSFTASAKSILLWLGVNPAVFELNIHSQTVTVFAVGFLLPLLANLAAIPIYLFVSRIADRPSALLSSSLFLLAPSMSLFMSEFDQLYALFAMTAFCAGWYSLVRKSAPLALLSGFTLFLASFFHFLLLSLIPMLALFAALFLWQQSGPTRLIKEQGKIAWRIGKTFLTGFAFFLTGFGTPLLLMKWIFDYPVWQVFRKAMMLNQVLVKKFPPPGIDLLHFALFLGIPTFLLLISALFNRNMLQILKGSSAASAKRKQPDSRQILTICFCALILALSLSGHVRVETGRLWIFLMPFACCIAGVELKRMSKEGIAPLLIVLLLVLAATFILRGALAVLNSPIYGHF